MGGWGDTIGGGGGGGPGPESIYSTIMELGPRSHKMNGLLGPNSIMVVHMDPLGKGHLIQRILQKRLRHAVEGPKQTLNPKPLNPLNPLDPKP